MRFVVLALALVASSPAVATGNDNTADQSAGAAEAASTSATQPKEARKICRRIDATESRIAAKKVCMTAEQWKRYDRNGG